MKNYKCNGKEELRLLKALLLNLVFLFLIVCQVRADIVWDSGHHEINDGDVYGEIWMYNDATADMWGGDVYQLGALDSSRFSMYSGTMDELIGRYDSIIYIYGGQLGRAELKENSVLNLYAYDVIHHSTGGYAGRGWIEGYYIGNDAYFSFDLINNGAFLHINIVEPIAAFIEIHPDTLNISSKGKWITCHMYFPEDYNVADVNSATITLQDEIHPEWVWFNEKQNILMAKFNRTALQEILDPGEMELTVTGYFDDGTYFEGRDTIKVIDKK